MDLEGNSQYRERKDVRAKEKKYICQTVSTAEGGEKHVPGAVSPPSLTASRTPTSPARDAASRPAFAPAAPSRWSCRASWLGGSTGAEAPAASRRFATESRSAT